MPCQGESLGLKRVMVTLVSTSIAMTFVSIRTSVIWMSANLAAGFRGSRASTRGAGRDATGCVAGKDADAGEDCGEGADCVARPDCAGKTDWLKAAATSTRRISK